MGYVEELRKLVGKRPILVPGVRAIIRDESGAVLLQLRSDFKIWGLPAGGMELGESVQDALRREVFEETEPDRPQGAAVRHLHQPGQHDHLPQRRPVAAVHHGVPGGRVVRAPSRQTATSRSICDSSRWMRLPPPADQLLRPTGGSSATWRGSWRRGEITVD